MRSAASLILSNIREDNLFAQESMHKTGDEQASELRRNPVQNVPIGFITPSYLF
jgi:hypothetical protein